MGKPAQSAQFTVGDWTVEPNLGRIHRNSESAVLEPRIMDLLVELASHAGETVSTDELVQRVWSGRIVSDQPVYQGIAQLRKALDDEAPHPRYIATVTKKGYRLIASVGVPESEAAPTGDQPQAVRQHRILVPALSLMLVGVYLFLSISDVAVSHAGGSPVPSAFGSIAVLPFVDMSEDRSHQYLGDGLAEELIHRLSALQDVRVVARTSSFSFRDSNSDVQEIGRQLGADVILEGSIRRSGSLLRITAQLVNVSDGYHVWSRSFEAASKNAFAIQDQIALSVARLLQTGVDDYGLPARSWTQNTDAAELYYLGVFQMHKRRAESLDKALEYFQKALALDPQFALAYSGIAKAYFLASDQRYGNLPDIVAMQKSSAALRMAESLDDRLVEVLELQIMEANDGPRIAEAESLILSAIDLYPNHAPTYHQYGMLLYGSGRWYAALIAWQKAVARDPLSPVLRVNLGLMYSFYNRLAEAEAEFLLAIELDPSWHAPYFRLAQLLSTTDELARAIVIGKKALSVEGSQARWAGHAAMLVGNSYLTLGDFAAAEQWFGHGEELGIGGWYQANHQLYLLLAQNRFSEADALLSQCATKQPNFENIFSLGGLYRSIMDQNAAATGMFERALSLSANASTSNLLDAGFLNSCCMPAVYLARLYLLAGKTKDAEQLLAQSEQYLASVRQESAGSPGRIYARATIYSLKGNDRDALASLGLAVERGWSELWFVERDPVFADYHGNPVYESIIEQMKGRLFAERQKLVRWEESRPTLYGDVTSGDGYQVDRKY